jgi:hypothetical protein
MAGVPDNNRQLAIATGIASIETFANNLVFMKTSFRSEVNCVVSGGLSPATREAQNT